MKFGLNNKKLISSFQTFIYLFAPICTNIRESDFNQNIRLENGKQIWQALWEYRHPDAEGFIAPVSCFKLLIIFFVDISREKSFHLIFFFNKFHRKNIAKNFRNR